MRKLSFCALLSLCLLVLLGAVACGSASNEQAAAASATPQAVLTSMMEKTEKISSATGSFDVSLAFDLDSSQVPAEVGALLTKPMAISGSFAQAQESKALELALKLSIGGEEMKVGLKSLGDKFWVSMLDQWYEAPAEMVQGAQLSSFDQEKGQQILDLAKELGVDPLTWFPDLKLSDEKLGSENVHHLSGHPDVAKIMADALGLMQSKEFMALLDPSGSLTGVMGMGELLPGPEELQKMQGTAGQLFKDLSLDLWVTKDGSEMRKAVVKGRIVPPAEEAEGLNAIDLTVTVLLDKYNQPVKVEAPGSALPFSELQKAMQENPEKFLGPLQPLMMGISVPST